MTHVHPLSAATTAPAEILGGKGHGLVTLCRLGLSVPPGFVLDTRAGRATLGDGRFPDGLDAAVRALETATRRRFGGPHRPLLVSVRSGAAVTMPGMMSTILHLGLTSATAAALRAETGDASFVDDCRSRLAASFAAASAGTEVPDDAPAQLRAAVRAVFSSWHTARAHTYRELHGIPHDRGTAVVVQAMVFGNRDARSGSGVAFSRDPSTGERTPSGEVLVGRPGEDVVSGREHTRPLAELAGWDPAVWAELLAALDRVERHYRDVCQVEFTVESGRLWLLQVRPGGLTGRAALRVAADLADEGTIDRRTAVRRITAADLRGARLPRIRTGPGLDVLTRGHGASPGVATGRIAVTADHAARMAADGPVVLVRPTTSPLDMHGLAAARGIVTSRGGPASHAAVVARAMGKPAVVQAAGLTVDVAAGCVRAGERVVAEGSLVTLDGTGGEVVLGDPGSTTEAAGGHLARLLGWADDISGDSSPRTDEQRLAAAHARHR